MSKIRVTRAKERKFDGTGPIRIARDVGTDISTTLAAGVVTFENCKHDWTVSYDEYLYCLEGELTIRIGGEAHVLKPGDGMWLPNGTAMTYEAKEKATAIFAVHPANWRELRK